MRVHWLQHVPFEGLGSIDAWLRGRHARVTATRFYEDATLPGVDALDLIVAMGGPMSVNDGQRLPWLAAEQRFLADAIDRGVAVLGVCLGAQSIARALGARVYPNAEREIGWWPVTGGSVDPGVPSWARNGAVNTVFHWHGETFDLPAGATPLASSEACAHQAFQVGDRVIGIQFHLETTKELVDGLVANCQQDLAAGRFVQSAERLTTSDACEFAGINRLMTETLDCLCGSSVDRAG
ncbi:MAG: type 1 glutamine amidotransferase [Vicinamibacterales bacterium]